MIISSTVNQSLSSFGSGFSDGSAKTLFNASHDKGIGSFISYMCMITYILLVISEVTNARDCR